MIEFNGDQISEKEFLRYVGKSLRKFKHFFPVDESTEMRRVLRNLINKTPENLYSNQPDICKLGEQITGLLKQQSAKDLEISALKSRVSSLELEVAFLAKYMGEDNKPDYEQFMEHKEKVCLSLSELFKAMAGE